MKRNRFADLVPPTPEDFHGSVLDALHRMEAVRGRRRQRNRALMSAAAALVVMLALTAALYGFLSGRPTPEDTVATPEEGLETVRPEQLCWFDVGAWQVDENGVRMDWTIAGTEGELLLYNYDIQFIGGDGLWNGTEFFERPAQPGSIWMGLLGREVLGHELQTVVRRSQRFDWSEPEKMVRDGLTAVITLNFYRPKAELFEDPAAVFSGAPHLMLQPLEGGLEAWPVDWSGNADFQTPFGESKMTILSDYEAYRQEHLPRSAEEALEDMVEYARLQRLALDVYGYAEFVKGYEMTIDLTAGSGSGATVLREVDA